MSDQRSPLRELKEEAHAYRSGTDRPLGGYLAVMTGYGLLVAMVSVIAALTGRRPPRRVPAQDLAVIALGTHKLSRTLSKDAVTSPLRAPFTRYQETGGPAEVMEEVRKPSGLRHSLGELVSCPFCLDVWVVTAFTAGLVFAPRITRVVAGSFASLAGADFLQLAYARAQQAVES
jgi:uncharacterized protein DUF1360